MRRNLVFVMVAFVVSLRVNMSPVSANWFGATGQTGCNSPNEANDRAHTFAYVAPRSDVLAAASYA